MPIWYSFSPLVCVCRSHLFSALPLLPSCGSGTSFFSSFFSRESCCFPILVFCTYKSPSCIVLSISKDRLVSWARCRIWRSLVDKTELVMMVMLWEGGGSALQSPGLCRRTHKAKSRPGAGCVLSKVLRTHQAFASGWPRCPPQTGSEG